MTLSEQRRADAMADAETLERIAWELDSKAALHVANALRRARGFIAGLSIDAREAAHAAFRAVPGLRGK